jgi:hypothetical protein
MIVWAWIEFVPLRIRSLIRSADPDPRSVLFYPLDPASGIEKNPDPVSGAGRTSPI